MYKCDLCGDNTVRGVSMYRMIAKTRPKTYPMKKNENGVIDYGGIGSEIVKELKICVRCALLGGRPWRKVG